MTDLKAIVTDHARAAGFDLVGVTSAADFAADREVALARIREGRMDGLAWYSAARVWRGASPGELLPGAQSVICLGVSYLLGDDDAAADGDDDDGGAADGNDDGAASVGRVARYARVRDYHRAMKRRMRDFVRGLEQALGAAVAARWYVDDGPMLDRAAANRAGLGWFGKNTNILTAGHGSWALLGQVITDLPLTPDAPLKKSCGACVRCIDDCPTGAIVAPYVVDNARCISYLTIENRGPIPRALRPLIGDWVFGCDICQDVCPVNRKARPGGLTTKKNSVLSVASVVNPALDLIELLEMSEADFRARFAGTSIMRAKWDGMRRNACVALGNAGDAASVPALGRALRQATPLVRGHAAWALGRIGGPAAAGLLAAAAGVETDAGARAEIAAALADLSGRRSSVGGEIPPP